MVGFGVICSGPREVHFHYNTCTFSGRCRKTVCGIIATSPCMGSTRMDSTGNNVLIGCAGNDEDGVVSLMETVGMGALGGGRPDTRFKVRGVSDSFRSGLFALITGRCLSGVFLPTPVEATVALCEDTGCVGGTLGAL